MGVQYSKVIQKVNVAEELNFSGLSLIDIRTKMLRISRKYNKYGTYFLNKNDIKLIFDNFDDIQIYKCFTIFNDKNSVNPLQISSLDFFGGLTLLSQDNMEDKVIFLYQMGDLDEDDFMSYDDLFILLSSISRGCSLLKGYLQVPSELIDRIIIESFKANSKTLNSNGEISLMDFKAFVVSYDSTRSYLMNISGVRVDTVVDATAIISKRTDLLRDIVTTRAEIDNILLELQELEENDIKYSIERGGDIELLRITQNESANYFNNIPINNDGMNIKDNKIPVVNNNKSSTSVSHKKKSLLSDAEAFSESRGGKPAGNSRNIYSDSFKISLLKVWKTYPQNDHDLMVQLDEFILINIFDTVGITIQYSDATRCLKNCPKSQINRYHFDDILLWYQNQNIPEINARNKLNSRLNKVTPLINDLNLNNNVGLIGVEWKKFSSFCYDFLHNSRQVYNQCLNYIESERSVLNHINAISLPSYILNNRNNSNNEKNDNIDNYNIKKYYSLNPRVNRPSNNLQSSPLRNNNKSNDILSKFQEFKNMTTRSRQAKPSVILFDYLFGQNNKNNDDITNDNQSRNNSDDESNSRSNSPNKKTSPLKNTKSKLSNNNPPPSTPGNSKKKKKNVNDENHYKLSFKFNFNTNPFSATNLGTPAINMENRRIIPVELYLSINNVDTIDFLHNNQSLPVPGQGLGSALIDPLHGLTQFQNNHNYLKSEVIRDFNHLQSHELLEYFNELVHNNQSLHPGGQNNRMNNNDNDKFIDSNQSVLSRSSTIQTFEDNNLNNINDSNSYNVNINDLKRKNKKFSSIEYITFKIKENLRIIEEEILIQTLWNYFSTIPIQDREYLYTEVCVKSFYISYDELVYKNKSMDAKSTDNNDGKSRRSSFVSVASMSIDNSSLSTTNSPKQMAKSVAAINNSGQKSMKKDTFSVEQYPKLKIILVALLNESNPFKELEEFLVNNDLYISRSIVKAKFEFMNEKNLKELFLLSKKFYSFENKLFGPQEDELGEENMNPLIYAKLIRNKKKQYNDLINKLTNNNFDKTFSRDELISFCHTYGVKDTGLNQEISLRLINVLKKELELLGHGELSLFGKKIIQNIFQKFNISNNVEEQSFLKSMIAINKSNWVTNKSTLNKTNNTQKPPSREQKPPSRSSSPERLIHNNKQSNISSDIGLSLWEINQLLFSTNTPTFYDQKSYHEIMNEKELLVDRDQNLRLSGLYNLYLQNGKLNYDNKFIGIGSLNNILTGRFRWSTHFENESLSSLFGNNLLFIQFINKFILLLSSIRELKMEGNVDNFSDILQLFHNLLPNDNQYSQWMSSFIHNLNEPGWLAYQINDLLAYLADGKQGIIPSLRSIVLKEFNKYDIWDIIFTESINEKYTIDCEFLKLKANNIYNDILLHVKNEEDNDSNNVLFGNIIGNNNINNANNKNSNNDNNNNSIIMINDGESVGNSTSSSSNSNNSNAMDPVELLSSPALLDNNNKDESTSNEDILIQLEDELYQIESQKQELRYNIIQSFLPPLPSYLDLDLPSELLKYKKQLLFLNEFTKQSNNNITLQENKKILKRKDDINKKLNDINELMKNHQFLQNAHTCAAYDSIRLFTIEILSVGMGTKEFNANILLKGFEYNDFLPKGNGEYNIFKQEYLDKIERSKYRKSAALAALEREKLRRNMTEEEKEALRLEKELQIRKQNEHEELLLFQKAYEQLVIIRNKIASTVADKEIMSKLWEELVTIREERYPEGFVTAITQNNYSCILIECFGIGHPLSQASVSLLKSAVDIIMIRVVNPKVSIEHLIDYNAYEIDHSHEVIRDESSLSQVTFDPSLSSIDPIESLDPLEIKPRLIIIANYLFLLTETESTSLLLQSFEIKIHFYYLFNYLDETNQQNIRNCLSNNLFEMPIFAITLQKNSNNNDNQTTLSGFIDELFDEMDEYIQMEQIETKEEEAERLRKELLLSQVVKEDLNDPKVIKRLRLEKKKKFE
eukprot:gene10543-14165_t